jgi:lysophospholipase L1-like esterase
LGRKLVFGLAGILLTLALTAGLLEAGLRIYSAVTPNVDVEFYRYASTMKGSAENSGVRFLHKPGSHHRLFGVDVQINSRGFRDTEPASLPPGARRIALIGDSVTFGWGVPYGDRFSELLEREWSTGPPIELINTGHGNWNSVQEYAALSELLAQEALSGVLQVWYINDAEPTPEYRPAPWYARSYVAIFLWSKSDLLQRRMGARQTYADYYRSLYKEDSEGFPDFRDALMRTGEWARERDLPWVFVLLPEFHEFPGPFGDVYARVRALADSAGAQVIDLTETFAGEDPSTMWVAHNDVHPNARGHAAIARGIAERLDPAVFRGSRP